MAFMENLIKGKVTLLTTQDVGRWCMFAFKIQNPSKISLGTTGISRR